LRPDGTLSPETATRRFLDALTKPSRILVAISGGSDSTGLLVALADALKATPNSATSFCAATVDHALRADSADEARQVAALCHSLGIPHVTKTWLGPKPKTGIMAAARDARYELLAEAADEFAADLAVTGHTFDDQRETLVMRGARSEAESTGIADLVLFGRRLWIARPFLSCLREDIRAVLRARQLPWLDDPSNDDPKYERVRMRLALKDQAAAAPVVDAGGRRASLAADAARWLTAHFVVHACVLGQVSLAGLAADRSVLEYALSRLAAVFGGQPYALGREQTGALLALIEKGEPARMTAGRVVFDLRRNGLFLCRESRGILPLVLSEGGCGTWDGRFEIRNHDRGAVRIEAAGSVAMPAADDLRALPKSALRRAYAALPHFVDADGEALSGGRAGKVLVTPYFAPFDRFLTRFDVIFADSLTAAFGTRPYPKAPLGLIDGKTI
jgi:tRNA(Ile)-lysidine synthase